MRPALFSVPVSEVLANVAGAPGAAADERACVGEDPAAFFPDDFLPSMARKQRELAKSICRRCPIRESCLADALERGEEYGVWGGVDFAREEVDGRQRPAS